VRVREDEGGPPEGFKRDDVEERTRALFRSIALERQGYYDASPGGRPRLSVWQKRIRRMVLGILDDRLRREPSFRRVLDAGCGRGDFTLALAARYERLEEIVGCDFSAELIELARSSAAGRPRVRFAIGALDALPLARAQADVTVCINVLHHVPRERRSDVFAELARVTGRVLLLEIKNASSPYFRWHSQRVEGVPIFPVTIAEMRDRLSPHGFTLVGRRGIFGLLWLSPLVVLQFEKTGSAEPDPLHAERGFPQEAPERGWEGAR
jgi:SAM-dependent methyltransferase